MANQGSINRTALPVRDIAKDGFSLTFAKGFQPPVIPIVMKICAICNSYVIQFLSGFWQDK